MTLPADLEVVSGRQRIDKLKPVLERLGVQGEVGWVRHLPKQHQLVIPVTVPGRLTTVTLDVTKREASIERRTTGLADALVVLHMSPGQHGADIRKNWIYMRVWSWLADATVYVTRAASDALAGEPIGGRIVPSARVFSVDAARDLVSFIVRANVDALAARVRATQPTRAAT